MTKRLTITFTDEQAETIEKIATVKGISFADTVRRLCDEAIKIQVSNDNIDLVTEIIDERLRAILKPQVERLASISVKGAIMSATSTFLNAQALNDFVPPERRKDFNTSYEKARLKGIAYVKSKVYDIDDIKKDI
ncbi:hypothetical protein KQI30_16620 [Clostridium bornimense]|uniref:hypothetical protein n=1 Tax=Clostridium bornimense TaxID=1216932 RepID=UPI001C1091AF|nr:hypothetical protein [Clostridium bornimense]MBU5317873.1 hypothetical protein [Clostridium bornimense]